MLSQINPVVLEIGQIPLEGNLIPHSWFQHLKFHSGKPDLPAIVILSEIIYWYRPFYEEKEKLPRQKFHGDMFQSNAKHYTNKFGFTKKQVRDALKRLDNEGYIRREYRSIQTKEGIVLNERMFVEPILAKIREVTYPQTTTTEPKPNDLPLLTGDPPSLTGDPPSLTSDPYTKTSTETSTNNKKTTTTYLEVDTISKNTAKIPKKDYSVTQSSKPTTYKHVTKGHEAHDETSHEGHTTKDSQLKEMNLRNTTTTTSKLSTGEPSESSSQEDNKKPTTTSAVTVASKPDEDSGDLVFDFALKDFSPEQQRRALNLLKNIPTVEGKQSVLDEFNSAYQQGTIKSPWHYLSTLVKKYQSGEFTATSELPEQRARIQAEADLNLPSFEEAFYEATNGRGRFHYQPNGYWKWASQTHLAVYHAVENIPDLCHFDHLSETEARHLFKTAWQQVITQLRTGQSLEPIPTVTKRDPEPIPKTADRTGEGYAKFKRFLEQMNKEKRT